MSEEIEFKSGDIVIRTGPHYNDCRTGELYEVIKFHKKAYGKAPMIRIKELGPNGKTLGGAYGDFFTAKFFMLADSHIASVASKAMKSCNSVASAQEKVPESEPQWKLALRLSMQSGECPCGDRRGRCPFHP